ncbi:keratin-associated protein 13-1-like [Mustela lutreola]|uniref:keratin-associated protein 13-1-like n=1 Tax=Mustela lutreola TaxID=9666 RepID=UPI0027970E23|nr:keratin-associated protein 13-1-like [Mustela lutreola]
MSYSCCSATFYSHSLGGYLSYPSSCGSFCLNNLVYPTDICSLSTCQLGPSLSGGCQETYCDPTSFQMSYMVSSPFQTISYHQRTSIPCDPCQSAYPGSPGCGSSRSYCLGYGPRSSYSLGCGSHGFRSLGYGVYGFLFLGFESRFCSPTYLAFRNCQTSCCQLICRSGFSHQSTC